MKKLTVLLAVCFLITMVTGSMAARPHWGAEGYIGCYEDGTPIDNYPVTITYEIKWNQSSDISYFTTTVYTNTDGDFYHKHFVVAPFGTTYTVDYVNIYVTANAVQRSEIDASQGITDFGHWKPFCYTP